MSVFKGNGFLRLSGGTLTGPILAASGSKTAPSYSFSAATGNGWYYRSGITVGLAGNAGKEVFQVTNSGSVALAGSTLGLTSSGGGDLSVAGADVNIVADAANVVAVRNGTSAQTSRVYNTFTDASNGEWAEVAWSSNVAYIRAQKNGAGTQRLMVPVTGATTVAGLPAAATAGAGARAFVTDATVTTFMTTVAGGGANAVPVVSDGSAWKIG